MNAATRIRNQCFVAAIALGVAAGICKAQATLEQDLAHLAFAGATLVIVGCFLGGFAGLYVKNAIRWALGVRLVDDEDTSHGMIICGCFGTFFGLIYPFVADQPEQAVTGVFLGALIGAAVGAVPGDMLPTTMRLLAESERSE